MSIDSEVVPYPPPLVNDHGLNVSAKADVVNVDV